MSVISRFGDLVVWSIACNGLIFFAPFISAADFVWEPKRDEDGISVYTKEIENSRYRAFKGVVEVQASLPSVLGLLSDYSACSQWIYRCVEARQLESRGFVTSVFYQVTDLPFPAKSREAVFQGTVRYGDEKSLYIDLVVLSDFALKGDLLNSGNVRMQEGKGTYKLEALSATTTRVTWEQHINPAGVLPAFLINSLVVDVPYQTLRNMRSVVKDPRYQSLTFTYNPAGIPDGFVKPLDQESSLK